MCIRDSPEAYQILQQYNWPGNIRELRNLAEQLSVLSDDRMITSENLIESFPHLLNRNLPVLAKNGKSANGSTIDERDILYKFLFEMKADLKDLKNLVYGLAQTNDLEMPIGQQSEPYYPHSLPANDLPQADIQIDTAPRNRGAIIINQPNGGFQPTETVEENLSLVDMEKEMIGKALKKHKGRRKEAAKDLKISERTLYRKIKEYELE